MGNCEDHKMMINQVANVDIAMYIDHNIDDLFAFLRGGKTFELSKLDLDAFE